MPPRKGKRLGPRRSVSGKYNSIRDLVFDLFEGSNGTISKEEVDAIVRKEYPKSRFFKRYGIGGHFTWYKHTWNKRKAEELREEESMKGRRNDKRHEGAKNRRGRAKDVESSRVAKVAGRKENKWIQNDKGQRKMAIKARKKVFQRQKHHRPANKK